MPASLEEVLLDAVAGGAPGGVQVERSVDAERVVGGGEQEQGNAVFRGVGVLHGVEVDERREIRSTFAGSTQHELRADTCAGREPQVCDVLDSR